MLGFLNTDVVPFILANLPQILPLLVQVLLLIQSFQAHVLHPGFCCFSLFELVAAEIGHN